MSGETPGEFHREFDEIEALLSKAFVSVEKREKPLQKALEVSNRLRRRVERCWTYCVGKKKPGKLEEHYRDGADRVNWIYDEIERLLDQEDLRGEAVLLEAVNYTRDKLAKRPEL